MSDDAPFHRLLADARPRIVTQDQAATAAGVRRGTISLWERGHGQPSAGQLALLWARYGTAPDVREAMMAAAGRGVK